MLLLGDCLEQLKRLDNNSIDSIVTDPPYGLNFMGKKWDYDVPSVQIWQECLRVLKPGGHLLAFFGTRTYHRGVVRIEDAGFEIRDQIQWIYGSGFPKSTDVSKRIDKEGDAYVPGEVLASSRKSAESQTGIATTFRKKTGVNPQTDAAKQWQGWGTALKPANEPIVVARKPLEKGLTVAENVQKWGCGAINVDGSRIETSDIIPQTSNQNIKNNAYKSDNSERKRDTVYSQHFQGRWPANVIFDEQAAAMLDEQSGHSVSRPHKNKTSGKSSASRFFYVAKASKSERNKGLEGMPLVTIKISGQGAACPKETKDGKPNKDIQNQNFHPTVKPIKLMQYLIKLVTLPNGTILDPFMGSGSTGVAAKILGFNFVGIEMNKEYFEIAKKRIEHHTGLFVEE